MTTPEEVQARNLEIVQERGPGLYIDMGIYVVARAEGYTLLGGLGAMGVGRMWFPGEKEHDNLPGYDDAPVVEMPEGERAMWDGIKARRWDTV